ncbi:hypothetical protein GCK72_019798 [Caenorhabditis remanei]|uniref:Uncharacterized protein n=1 Tax=Caenorhabditis remanei TaxID=31234 RepID=A0A6A5GFI3_CAERE|nr:hypothetical protein GCK72_019798 [Caenorhabditis remanei]KAF1753242.1 hypothetical protein GCK72_019798 [Caenorhabditis remanei]
MRASQYSRMLRLDTADWENDDGDIVDEYAALFLRKFAEFFNIPRDGTEKPLLANFCLLVLYFIFYVIPFLFKLFLACCGCSFMCLGDFINESHVYFCPQFL